MTEIPYFIEIKGCINCSVSKTMKEKTGNDYGFDHESLAGCIIRACVEHGYSITKPFIHPAEVIRMAKQVNTAQGYENARKFCLQQKERWGREFEAAGISIDTLLAELPQPA